MNSGWEAILYDLVLNVFNFSAWFFLFVCFFLPHWLFPVHRFVTAREINGWRLLLHCPSYKHPPPLPGFPDLFSVTFQLWPGSSSASQADPRQWSFWAKTQCLVNYKVTQHWSGSQWNVQPLPPMSPFASDKAAVLGSEKLCGIYFGFAIKQLHI